MQREAPDAAASQAEATAAAQVAEWDDGWSDGFGGDPGSSGVTVPKSLDVRHLLFIHCL